ncbi:uncharacterized protein RCC_08920 [Ramularia collo-cygni]|uniref:Uncharacterized protein n=1 Tax=Ramularia collo-cygni TaxID=112498 RepID=A0A2D3VIW1_9PEZI|nr:uncharacterized protein RCC_08920 [Ramularia collo-cygni]CZT23209.1 uncharacterized protein RCC_08920 [Ramularia collo-cygni]
MQNSRVKKRKRGMSFEQYERYPSEPERLDTAKYRERRNSTSDADAGYNASISLNSHLQGPTKDQAQFELDNRFDGADGGRSSRNGAREGRRESTRLAKRALDRRALILDEKVSRFHLPLLHPGKKYQNRMVFRNNVGRYLERGDFFQTPADSKGAPDRRELRFHLMVGRNKGKLICLKGTTRGNRGMEEVEGLREIFVRYYNRNDAGMHKQLSRGGDGILEPLLLSQGHPKENAMLVVSEPDVVDHNDWIRPLSYRLEERHADRVFRMAHYFGVFIDLQRQAEEELEARKVRDREVEAERKRQDVDKQRRRFNDDHLQHSKSEYTECKPVSVPVFGWNSLVGVQPRKFVDAKDQDAPAVVISSTPTQDLGSPSTRVSTKSSFQDAKPLQTEAHEAPTSVEQHGLVQTQVKKLTETPGNAIGSQLNSPAQDRGRREVKGGKNADAEQPEVEESDGNENSKLQDMQHDTNVAPVVAIHRTGLTTSIDQLKAT